MTNHQPTTTHPVDSTYFPCCSSIGRHSPDCATFTSVPPPTGAVELHPFKGDRRRFFGRSRDDAAVVMAGDQDRNGAVIAAWVSIENSVSRLSAREARAMARALVAAADEVDELGAE